MALPESKEPPEWIHLLPAGEFRGVDGRGPYTVANADTLILNSMKGKKKLVLDENHSTDLAQEKGGSAPAVGWIVELQSRQDGIWGKVEWTRQGKALMEDKSYEGVSPAFAAVGKNVTRIVRASLTNVPNLTLTHLHTQEHGMNPSDIARRLGLPENTPQPDLETALNRAGQALQLHTQAITIAGLSGSPSVEAIVTGLKAKTSSVETHAQQQITELKGQVQTLTANAARTAAEAAVKAASDNGAVITEDMRGELVTLHMQNPESAEKIISGLPKLGKPVERHTQRKSSASDVDTQVAGIFGLKVDDLKKTRGDV
ncbi:hypothetical protein GMO_21420 [Gluconobacter morbifer G707]|uniref:Mu-like prophage I protein n=2 Tax=Gluconobacter TaxID=441 RepID=G6XKX6_9PROT|nr:hypothetical protein GMO_21420 [Gluconobacter morbifer G707]